MYYRRYFEGNVENPNETSSGLFAGISYSIYKNQSIILGNAIKQTLIDAGMNAKYDEETLMLYPNQLENTGIGIFITSFYVVNIYLQCSGGYKNTQESQSAYSPFNQGGTSYKFYVTLLGDPKNFLRINIGCFSDVGNILKTTIYFAYGTDKRDMQKIIYIYPHASGANTSTFYAMHALDGSAVDGLNALSTAVNFNQPAVTGTEKDIVLIDLFSQQGYFTIDDCYIGCSALTPGLTSFYLINGEEYYYPTSCILVKCKSKISV